MMLPKVQCNFKKISLIDLSVRRLVYSVIDVILSDIEELACLRLLDRVDLVK